MLCCTVSALCSPRAPAQVQEAEARGAPSLQHLNPRWAGSAQGGPAKRADLSGKLLQLYVQVSTPPGRNLVESSETFLQECLTRFWAL